jgi:NADH-quinone oxidoreductase subunit L
MDVMIWIALFAPLAGFIILVASSHWIQRRLAGYVACTTVGLSFICFTMLLLNQAHEGKDFQDVVLYSWLPIKGIHANFTLHLDHLSMLMTLIITGIGFFIHVYSIGYMEHENDFARYFAFLNFFIFAMLLLVLAGHLLLLFVGWEGVGLASYLLIGFWYDRPAAAKAATKAFVVNRIGDFGFLIGLLLTFHLFGTGNILEINQRVNSEFTSGASILTLLTLLYFIGAAAKSAQLPLHTWLPDAMEGPTPVSALIHAATMVTAGVYLIVRMHPVFMLAPATLQIIGIIGAATSLFAAFCAVGQLDLKRVLAYSTVSQLGLMFLACGAGAFYSAMFHLTTHAFMKSLLFLSAGNVVHMMHGKTDMEKMGGLSKIFTKTHWFFLIGVLAMSGIPPLAAFFSKDLILEQEYLAGFETLYYIGLGASILTGFYLMRAYCLTFTGKLPREENALVIAKEAPPIMLIPLGLLALLSIGGGFLGFAFGKTPILECFLMEIGITPAEKELSTGLALSPEMIMAVLGALIGVGLSLILYTRFKDRIGKTIPLFQNSFYLNEIYWNGIVIPLKAFSQFLGSFIEPKVFNGSINLTTNVVQGSAHTLQRIQSGQIRSYVAWIVIGTVFLFAYFVF